MQVIRSKGLGLRIQDRTSRVVFGGRGPKLKVYVPNDWVLKLLALELVQVLEKCLIIRYLAVWDVWVKNWPQ